MVSSFIPSLEDDYCVFYHSVMVGVDILYQIIIMGILVNKLLDLKNWTKLIIFIGKKTQSLPCGDLLWILSEIYH